MYQKRHEMQKSDGPTLRQGPFLARAKTAAAFCALEMSREATSRDAMSRNAMSRNVISRDAMSRDAEQGQQHLCCKDSVLALTVNIAAVSIYYRIDAGDAVAVLAAAL